MRRLSYVLAMSILCSCVLTAQWVQTNGPYGGEITSLAVKGDTVFAGTGGNGVFISVDRGMSWTRASCGLGDYPPYQTDIIALAIRGGSIFAGTLGVYRSTNNGVRWAAFDNGLTTWVTYSLGTKDSIVFLGTDGGLFRSTNNGMSWVAMNNGLRYCSVSDSINGVLNIESIGVSGGNVFVGDCAGPYLSTDDGASWTQGSWPVGQNPVCAFAFTGSNIFAAAGGVFRSTNNGATWTSVSQKDSGWVSAAVYSLLAVGSNIYAGTVLGVYRSTNNGGRWTTACTGIANQMTHALATCGSSILAGTWGGVFSSTDNGASWSPSDSGLAATTACCILANGADIIAGTEYSGIFHSTNKGATWIPISNGLTNLYSTSIIAFPPGSGKLFAGTWGNGVFRSTDNGANWTQQSLLGMSQCVSALLVSGSSIFAGTYLDGVHLSTDSGASWTAVNNGLSDIHVRSLAASACGGGTCIFAGTNSTVFRSTDSGAHWSAASTGLPSNSNINSLAVSGNDVFAATSSVYRTTDCGATWIPANNGLPSLPVIMALAARGDSLWAATSIAGVYFSSDRGTTWADYNDGFGNPYPRSLALSDSEIYVGAMYSSVWRRDLSQTGSPTVPITASGGVHGTMAPSGLVQVPYGEASSQRFVFTPDIGYYLDSLFVDGVLTDSVEGYTFFCVLSPHTIRTVYKAYPPIECGVGESWDLVSVPVRVVDNGKSALFPSSVAKAFAYERKYVTCDSLVTGLGYWLKFPSKESLYIAGSYITKESVAVAPGWNLIGSISHSVVAASVISNPPGMITSEFYGYNGTYLPTDTLRPGRGYWVEAQQAGVLLISSEGAGLARAHESARIRIVPTRETPPSPPLGESPSGMPIPTEFSLSQAYPNPFNPVTLISYQLPVTSYVQLKVYDLLGREVASLVDELKQAGEYTVGWDASKDPSGVYFYTLRAGSSSTSAGGTFTQTKKVLLLK